MSRPIKITVVVLVLLVVVAVSHQLTGTTLEDIMATKPKGHDHSQHAEETATQQSENQVQLPDPLGSPGAPVEINVYVTSDNECDTSTLDAMKGIAEKYQQKVYIQFLDMLEPALAQEAQDAKIGCKSGLTINGESTLQIPGRGIKGFVMFDGPVGEMNYSLDDVEAAVVYLAAEPGEAGAQGRAEEKEETLSGGDGAQ